MAWLTDLTTALGLPGAGATLAAAVYGVSVAVEKSSRKEAREDIAHALKDMPLTAWKGNDVVVRSLFDITLGERHFSLKCIGRSIIASVLVVFALAITLFFQNSEPIDVIIGSEHIGDAAEYMVLITFWLFAPDYISLLKTRRLISSRRPWCGRTPRVVSHLHCFHLSLVGSLPVFNRHPSSSHNARTRAQDLHMAV
jgi:hypothetical protein